MQEIKGQDPGAMIKLVYNDEIELKGHDWGGGSIIFTFL